MANAQGRAYVKATGVVFVCNSVWSEWVPLLACSWAAGSVGAVHSWDIKMVSLFELVHRCRTFLPG